MKLSLLVFLGGGLGSVLRYWTILAAQRVWPDGTFPRGVLIANLLGSFIIGFLVAVPVMKARDAAPWLFAATGVLGGYTTFSSLANDTLQLWINNHPMLALLNMLGSMVAGILAAALGLKLGQILFS
ncbi:fluoride efflux transporter CrcB [Brevifollis gellanilyticus]|uniref:Fluoride-specific ion channel FluC n=1 Tax=Brevifollis gellanilyticus TaxID=748831 RepID=A0A512MEQ4_9BACT|nr:fluoride efflux transporter CrcB [Brevifollis gellanilyticus]GEP45178.1 putative fluoride ion transporter CrcB [Brevifollis gellanilyticus]